jgi:glycosyltransferase involved in cell wall biosynthesis
MKILILSHEGVYPPITGIKKAVYQSALCLAEGGNEVTMIDWGPADALTMKEGRLTLIQTGGPRRMSLNSKKALSSITGKIMRATAHETHLSQLMTLNDKGKWRLPMNKLDEGVDIILHEGPDFSPLPLIAKRTLGVPLIRRVWWAGTPWRLKNAPRWYAWTGEKWLPHVSTLVSPIGWGSEKVIGALEKRDLKGADCVIVVTHRDAQTLENQGFKSAVIPPAYKIPADERIMGPEEIRRRKGPYVFFSSHLGSAANRDAALFLVKIAKLVKRATFLLVGGGEELLKKMLLPDNVVLTGRLDEGKFAGILHASSLVVIPLIEGHGIQTKLVEALCYGKAVVTTSAVSAPFYDLVNWREFVEEDDPDRYPSVITSLLEDESSREHLERNAALYAKRFKPEAHAKAMKKMLKDAMRS